MKNYLIIAIISIFGLSSCKKTTTTPISTQTPKPNPTNFNGTYFATEETINFSQSIDDTVRISMIGTDATIRISYRGVNNNKYFVDTLTGKLNSNGDTLVLNECNNACYDGCNVLPNSYFIKESMKLKGQIKGVRNGTINYTFIIKEK